MRTETGRIDLRTSPPSHRKYCEILPNAFVNWTRTAGSDCQIQRARGKTDFHNEENGPRDPRPAPDVAHNGHVNNLVPEMDVWILQRQHDEDIDHLATNCDCGISRVRRTVWTTGNGLCVMTGKHHVTVLLIQTGHDVEHLGLARTKETQREQRHQQNQPEHNWRWQRRARPWNCQSGPYRPRCQASRDEQKLALLVLFRRLLLLFLFYFLLLTVSLAACQFTATCRIGERV